jgi:hypothetical protein
MKLETIEYYNFFLTFKKAKLDITDSFYIFDK